jgi:hypothetical protein
MFDSPSISKARKSQEALLSSVALQGKGLREWERIGENERE